MFGVSAVPTVQAGVGRTAYRQPAQATVQHRLLAGRTGGRPDPAAVQALRHELDAPGRVDVAGQILQHLGPLHQQTPPVQHFRVAALKVVVQVAIAVAQQAAIDVSDEADGRPAAAAAAATARAEPYVVQRVGPGVAAQMLELLGQQPALVGGRIHWQDRMVR